MKKDYEKLQYQEQEHTNWILWVNTAFTIVAGVATLALAVLTYLRQ